MTENLSIRGYLKSDRLECVTLFDSLFSDSIKNGEKASFINWLLAQERGTQSIPDSMGDFYYVVLKNYHLVGSGGFYLDRRYSSAHLTWFMIGNEFTGKGIGRLLMQHILAQIEHLFPENVIYATPYSTCKSFYEKFGFTNKSSLHQNGEHYRIEMIRPCLSTT